MGWLNDLFTGVASFIKTLGAKTKVEPLEPMTDENMGWGDAGKLALDEEPTGPIELKPIKKAKSDQ